MELLYLYDASKIRRFLSRNEKVKLHQKLKAAKTVSYLEDNTGLPDLLTCKGMVRSSVPCQLVLKKIGMTYVEYFSHLVVLNLETSGYDHGIIINKSSFISDVIPINESKVNRIFTNYSDDSLRTRFIKFHSLAQLAYIELLNKEEISEMKRVAERGKVMVKYYIKKDSM